MKTIRAFFEFCYLAHRDVHNHSSISQMESTLQEFCAAREIFQETGIQVNRSEMDIFSLPRQHSLEHYPNRIWDFGAPNGLCSFITESKHIKAVKEPWQQSNCFNALGQMLLTNQWLDKVAAAQIEFDKCSMLGGSLSNLSSPSSAEGTYSHTYV